MKFSNKVIKHRIYKEFLTDIQALEKYRIYCCHGLEHAVDVARLAWIYYLEEECRNRIETMGNPQEQRDMFYTAALLHDIGRVAQYRTGVHHSISGVAPAMEILQDIQVPEAWIKPILDVVSEHAQGALTAERKNLAYYITKADHDCRLCFACEAKESCKWTKEEKNEELKR